MIHHRSAGQPSDQETLLYRAFLQRLGHFVLFLPTCFLQAGKANIAPKRIHPGRPQTVIPYPVQRLCACLWLCYTDRAILAQFLIHVN